MHLFITNYQIILFRIIIGRPLHAYIKDCLAWVYGVGGNIHFIAIIHLFITVKVGDYGFLKYASFV